LTPLEVMLKAMRVHAKADRWDEAASIAKDAAPYMHPRLASMQHTGRNGGPIQTMDVSNLTDEQLAALYAALGGAPDFTGGAEAAGGGGDIETNG